MLLLEYSLGYTLKNRSLHVLRVDYVTDYNPNQGGGGEIKKKKKYYVTTIYVFSGNQRRLHAEDTTKKTNKPGKTLNRF